jgi:hypothetical protein
MEKTLESRISDLLPDIRRLLFVHFLVICREEDNMIMVNYIEKDIPMRSFIRTKIDKNFWKINGLQFTINCYDTTRLNIFDGVYVVIENQTLNEFKDFLRQFKLLQPLVNLLFGANGMGIKENGNTDIHVKGILLQSKNFISYFGPKKLLTINVNIDNILNKISTITGDAMIRVKRNRVQILSHKIIATDKNMFNN